MFISLPEISEMLLQVICFTCLSSLEYYPVISADGEGLGEKPLIWHCSSPTACYIEFTDTVPASGSCPGFYSLHVQMHSLLLHQFICSLKYRYVSRMALSGPMCTCACCKKVLIWLGLFSQRPLQGRAEEVKAALSVPKKLIEGNTQLLASK